MSVMWWILTMTGAVLGAVLGGWADLRRTERARRAWAAVGMDYGSSWTWFGTIGSALIFGLAGFCVGNLLGQWWF